MIVFYIKYVESTLFGGNQDFLFNAKYAESILLDGNHDYFLGRMH